VATFQLFEVWQIAEGEDKWDQVGSFLRCDPALALTNNRPNPVRLLKVTYENGQAVEQEVVAEVGATRPTP
jgi:hypothetical protein